MTAFGGLTDPFGPVFCHRSLAELRAGLGADLSSAPRARRAQKKDTIYERAGDHDHRRWSIRPKGAKRVKNITANQSEK